MSFPPMRTSRRSVSAAPKVVRLPRVKKAKPVLERTVKEQVKALLRTYGDRIYYRMHVPSGYGRTSLDFEGCVDGLFFAIETKRPGKKPTARQEGVLEEIRRAGGTTFVVSDEAGLRAVKSFIDLVLLQEEQLKAEKGWA